MALVDIDNMGNQLQGMNKIPVSRQIGLLIAVAASIAVGFYVVLWSQGAEYQVLYGNLSEKDSGMVADALQKSGIRYQVSGDSGAVLVEQGQVYNARMALAGQGLPKGTGSGFEILDDQSAFGTSQFLENARYQRAIEGELARTISSISNVQTARIHLALPKQSVFVRNRKKPSASVFIHLYPGRVLGDRQVGSIAHMVASSVPGLEIDQVTVVDQQGRLLSTNSGSESMQMTSNQYDYKRKVERDFINQIESIISPMVGIGGVKAQVSAEIDFTVSEQTQESFSPDQAVRSEQLSEEQSGSASSVGGIPGALTNQPASTAQKEDAASNSPAKSKRKSTKNYELDKTISHIRYASGTIQTLSVAVVINDMQTIDEEGVVGSRPLTEEELAKATVLVKQAIGFNEKRGDSVNVMNSTFNKPLPVEPLEESFMDKPWLMSAVKQTLAACLILFLVFGVIKPLLKDLAASGRKVDVQMVESVTADGQTVMLPAQGAQPSAEGATGGDVAQLDQQKSNYDQRLDDARALVNQDPKMVAQVVKGWTAKDE